MFIGKWNKSVVLTYLGCALAAAGFCVGGRPALACLMGAGLCDLLDGPLARRSERTLEEEAFGAELDSLADAVNFLALPVSVYVSFGITGAAAWAVYAFYIVCGLARLSDFGTREDKSGFRGLPVTYAALILPLSFVANTLAFGFSRSVALGTMAATGALFILDIPVPKPGARWYPFFFVLALAVGVALWLL